MDQWGIIAAILVVIAGAVWWFFFRDDGTWGSGDDVKLAPIDYRKKQAVGAEKKKIAKEGIPMKLVFYSQTGTAEDFSERIAEEVEHYGFAPETVDAEECETDNIGKEKVLVFCAATYGEGDPPDNALEFHEWLMSADREKDLLHGVRFAVFGLGNRTYDKFNEMGKVLDKRLEELGGERVVDVGLGDDDQNIENDFLRWKKDFTISLCKAFNLPPPAKVHVPVKRKQRMEVLKSGDAKLKDISNPSLLNRWRPAQPRLIDAKTPILAQIMTTRELHSSSSERSCLHVEISTCDGKLRYQPGDHVGVYPENDEEEVHRLAARLQVDLDQILVVYNVTDTAGRIPIVGPCTLKAALKQYIDITSPARKNLCAILAHYAQDEDDRNRLATLASGDPDEQVEYLKWIVDDLRTPYEVLKAFPKVMPPLDHFLEGLQKLQPRYYSISSSPSLHPNTVHITAIVVDYVTPTRRRARGVATTWFSEHRPTEGTPQFIPAFIRRSNFKLPRQPTTPIIMVGPGTGLAPFRGFLQEREALLLKKQSLGDSVLFFGCRDPEKDFIYRAELEACVANGALGTLSTAFSRVQREKIYVQHRLGETEMAKRVWKMIHTDGGYFYICGDAKNMARDVHHVLVKIFREQGNMSEAEAEAYIVKLQAANRFLSDVWS